MSTSLLFTDEFLKTTMEEHNTPQDEFEIVMRNRQDMIQRLHKLLNSVPLESVQTSVVPVTVSSQKKKRKRHIDHHLRCVALIPSRTKSGDSRRCGKYNKLPKTFTFEEALALGISESGNPNVVMFCNTHNDGEHDYVKPLVDHLN